MSEWHFSSHLHELRQRVIIALLAIIICGSVAYYFSEAIARFFMAPLFNAYPALAHLIYTNLTEAFVSYIKMAVLVGLAGSFPVVLYQCWMYVAPGLYRHEKRMVFAVVFWATFLFSAGVAFSYFVVLPKALAFLMSFAGDLLEPLPKLGAYLTFVARSSLGFGLAFEIPFLMVVAGKTGLCPREHFVNKRLYFYGAILVIAFLLTAGDFFAAGLLGVPLIGLYEAGILVMRIF